MNVWYVRLLGRIIRMAAVAMLVYLGLIGLTWLGFKIVPVGFIPSQDQGYLVGIARLPDGASLERAGQVVARACSLARQVPGVRNTVEFPGYEPLNGVKQPECRRVLHRLGRV